MPPNYRKILMTGAAGQIGSSLRQHLAPQYDFCCLDKQPIPDGEDMVTADILDFQAVFAATEGVKAVIHENFKNLEVPRLQAGEEKEMRL